MHSVWLNVGEIRERLVRKLSNWYQGVLMVDRGEWPPEDAPETFDELADWIIDLMRGEPRLSDIDDVQVTDGTHGSVRITRLDEPGFVYSVTYDGQEGCKGFCLTDAAGSVMTWVRFDPQIQTGDTAIIEAWTGRTIEVRKADGTVQRIAR